MGRDGLEGSSLDFGEAGKLESLSFAYLRFAPFVGFTEACGRILPEDYPAVLAYGEGPEGN